MPITVASATSATGPVPGTSSPSRSSRAQLVVDAGRSKDDAVDVSALHNSVRDVAIERLSLGVEAAELLLILREWTSAADPLPRHLHVDIEQHGEGRLGERCSY